MIGLIKEIIDKELKIVIEGARNGQIPTNSGSMYTKFYSSLYTEDTKDKDIPVLNLDNYQKIVEALFNYMKPLLTTKSIWADSAPRNDINEFIRKHIVYLFSNATYKDFLNPLSFINRYVDFLKDKTFSSIEIEPMYLENFDAYLNIKVVAQENGQETPYALDMSLKKKIDGVEYSYQLPMVRYGVCNENGEKVLYLYAIQNQPTKNLSDNEFQIKYNKDINRKFYKLNKGIDSNSLLLNVSPSFVFVEGILIDLMEKVGIDRMKIVKKLPQKIYIKEQLYGRSSSRGLSKRKIQALGIVTDIERLKDSLTTKFVTVSKRLEYHNEELKMISEDEDSFLCYSLEFDKKSSNNEVLNELSIRFDEQHIAAVR